MRLFDDDSSLFTRIQGVNVTHKMLVRDLQTITLWANQWKIQFNPNITKQAVEVIFAHKINKIVPPPLIYGTSFLLNT